MAMLKVKPSVVGRQRQCQKVCRPSFESKLSDSKQYLLPVHSESLSCQRGTNDCSRNVIDFRNYRKYTGESTITFGDPKK